jgi:hypothetical protein
MVHKQGVQSVGVLLFKGEKCFFFERERGSCVCGLDVNSGVRGEGGGGCFCCNSDEEMIS